MEPKVKKLFKLFGAVREYKAKALLAPLFMALEAFFEVLIPMVSAKLVDDGIQAGNMTEVLKYSGILVLLAIFMIMCGLSGCTLSSIASVGFGANLRHDIYYKVQGFSFTNVDKFSSASLVTRMTTDVNNIQQAFLMFIRMAIRTPFMFVFSFIAAIIVNKEIALIFLLVVPFLAVVVFLIAKTAFPIFGKVFRLYDDLNRTVSENVRGIRVVKSFVREEHETEKFKKTSSEIQKNFTKAERIVGLFSPAMNFFMYLVMLLIAFFGSKLIIASGATDGSTGGLSTGELTSIITYAMQILMALMMLSFIIVQITLSKASVDRISEVMEEQSDIVSPENAVQEVKDGSIEFKDVTFAYSKNADKNCLSNINLKINSGETIGIIGATGSSKSTLVQLIPRLYDASSGEVLVGGVNVKDYDLCVLRDSVAMVLQKNTLFSGTVRDNLKWGDENATDEEIRHACQIACADEFIEAHQDGYDREIEQGGSNVSGGQKQRLCIARALLKKPKILILDDSTSAVDTATDAKIRNALKNELPQTTKLIIAQRVASVMDADKILVLDDGNIVDFGTHEELLSSSPIYREVFNSQTKGGDDNG